MTRCPHNTLGKVGVWGDPPASLADLFQCLVTHKVLPHTRGGTSRDQLLSVPLVPWLGRSCIHPDPSRGCLHTEMISLSQQSPQPVLITDTLLAPHLCPPPLDPLREFRVSPLLRGAELGTALQKRLTGLTVASRPRWQCSGCRCRIPWVLSRRRQGSKAVTPVPPGAMAAAPASAAFSRHLAPAVTSRPRRAPRAPQKTAREP